MPQYRVAVSVDNFDADHGDNLEVVRTVDCESVEELHEIIQRTANSAKSHFDDVDPEDQE